MKEELEEGHFDAQGHYHWKKEKEVRDGWLDNIDWVKIKERPENKSKVNDDDMKGLGDESSSEDEPEEKFELMENYKEIFKHMKPKETIAKTLQRLGNGMVLSYQENAISNTIMHFYLCMKHPQLLIRKDGIVASCYRHSSVT